MAERGSDGTEAQTVPGGAEPGAVRRALDALAPLGDQVTAGGDLGRLTTYRVGGGAAVLVTARRPADLDLVRDAVWTSGLPLLVVGRGSNLLVADAGFGGIALVLDSEGFGAVIVDGVDVRAGAAVALPALARQTVDAGLTGLEWAVGVPGSVGGGVRMNAGGHGSDIAHTLHSCRVEDLDPRTSATATGLRPSGPPTWSWRPDFNWLRGSARSGVRPSATSCAGGANISPAARTPDRSLPTHPVNRPPIRPVG
jgi:FAD binding domain